MFRRRRSLVPVNFSCLHCLAIAGLILSAAAGCGPKDEPVPSATPQVQAEPPPEATALTLEPATTSVPEGAGTALAPNPTGDKAAEAVKVQSRFDRNSVWLSKLSKNDPVLRAQVRAEIQKAGLSQQEIQELRKMAAMYGVSF